MNNEIKEILDKLNEDKDYDDYVDYKGSYFKPLLDYITNLDEKYKKSCETYQQALDETMSEKMDLQEELDRCVKANIILDNENTELANNYVLTEYVDEMAKLKDENKRLNEDYKILKELQMKTNEENERLLHIAKKMHTYIFLNTDNEQEAYDKLGLTEEENIMLGYSGQIIITGGDDNE